MLFDGLLSFDPVSSDFAWSVSSADATEDFKVSDHSQSTWQPSWYRLAVYDLLVPQKQAHTERSISRQDLAVTPLQE